MPQLGIFAHQIPSRIGTTEIPSPPQLIVLQVVGDTALGIKIVHSIQLSKVNQQLVQRHAGAAHINQQQQQQQQHLQQQHQQQQQQHLNSNMQTVNNVNWGQQTSFLLHHNSSIDAGSSLGEDNREMIITKYKGKKQQ